jgi:hypothetical protein
MQDIKKFAAMARDHTEDIESFYAFYAFYAWWFYFP